jgi:hypothetical protein
MSRQLLWWPFAVALVGLVLFASARLTSLQPGWHPSLRLAVLLALTKTLADLLEAPLRPRRPTFYYADYVAQWLHYAALGLVAVVGHLLGGAVIDQPLTTGPLALGVYLVWRLTTPRA